MKSYKYIIYKIKKVKVYLYFNYFKFVFFQPPNRYLIVSIMITWEIYFVFLRHSTFKFGFIII